MSQSTLPRFGIFKTEARVIRSACVGQDYEIGVWLPFSYESSERKYPVLYVPDGEFLYPAVMGLMPTLMGNGEVPEMIVVGIAYHGISSWQEFGELRDRDFCPQTELPADKTSRLAQYTAFYQQELFPLIERAYRALADDRALFGFSSSGLFCAQMMFNQPGMFRRHVAASCTWPGAGDRLIERARQYAQQPKRPPVDLFLAVGGLEDGFLPNFQAMGELLRGGDYPEVRFASQVIENEGHSAGTIANTFLNGLRAVFKA